jgi:hypothetical protein
MSAQSPNKVRSPRLASAGGDPDVSGFALHGNELANPSLDGSLRAASAMS